MSERAEWRRRCVAAEVALAHLQQEREGLIATMTRCLMLMDEMTDLNADAELGGAFVPGGWNDMRNRLRTLTTPPTETQEPTR